MAKAEEKQQTRGKVCVSTFGGTKAAVTPWGLMFRVTSDQTVPPREAVRLDMETMVDRPMMLRMHQERDAEGLQFVGQDGNPIPMLFVDENTKLNLVVGNKTNRPVRLMKGQALVKAYVFDMTGVDVEQS